MCVEPFLLEILKNGTIIQSEDLRSQKAYHVFGRLPTSNFVLEHPSISRYKLVLFLKYKFFLSLHVLPVHLLITHVQAGISDVALFYVKYNYWLMVDFWFNRCHAVLQYRSNTDENDSDKACQDKGWYLYDLGSTHGT